MLAHLMHVVARRPSFEPPGADRLPASLALAVVAVVEAAQRGVDLAQVLSGLVEQRGHVLALERDRGAFGIVLVVGVGRACRVDDAGMVSLKRGQPVECLPAAPPRAERVGCRRLSSFLLTTGAEVGWPPGGGPEADVRRPPGYGRLEIWQLTTSP